MSPFTDLHGLASVGAGEVSITPALTGMVCPVATVPYFFLWEAIY